MNSVDFIYDELAKLSVNFPGIHFKYGFNDVIKTHIVELAPEIEYESNPALDNAWIPLSFKFKESFPDEDIAFVPPSSTLAIKISKFEFNAPIVSDVGFNFYCELADSVLRYTFPTKMTSATSVNISFEQALKRPQESVEDINNEYIYQSAA